MLDKLILLLEIIVASYCAYIYSEQYTKAGMVFNRLFLWSDNNLPGWLHKPFIGCFKCVCAQWAMWTYIIHIASSHALDFNLYNLLIFACTVFSCGCLGTGVGIISHKILNDE